MGFTFIRKIDKLGRIVLPKDVREKLELRCNDKIEIYIKEASAVLEKAKQKNENAE